MRKERLYADDEELEAEALLDAELEVEAPPVMDAELEAVTPDAELAADVSDADAIGAVTDAPGPETVVSFTKGLAMSGGWLVVAPMVKTQFAVGPV